MVTVAEDGSIIIVKDGAAYIMLPEPIECGVCKRMAAFVVNRGSTRCISCDDKEKQDEG